MLDAFSIFSAFASAMDSEWAFFAATAALCALLTLWKSDYRRVVPILSVIAISLLLSLALKPALALERPCEGGMARGIDCPQGFSLPSVHTAVAFALVAATVGLRTFPIYFIWGLLIGISRVYLNVHTVSDVGAGIAIAIFSTAIVDSLGISEGIFAMRGLHAPGGSGRHLYARDEFTRKIVQAFIGLVAIFSSIYLGMGNTVLAVTYCLAAGLVLFHLKSYGHNMPIVDRILTRLERPSSPAGFGALNFFAGLLICLTLIPSPQLALSAVFVLSISDGAAAFFGRGSRGLPHHPHKTYRGSLAFFLSALPVYFIGGVPALILATLATLIESLPLPLDDNLTIPWAGVIAFSALRAFG